MTKMKEEKMKIGLLWKYFLFGCLLLALLTGCAIAAPEPTATQVPPTATSIPPTNTSTQAPPTATATAMSIGGVWTTRVDMPTERWEHYTCVVDGKIYVIGGAGPVYQALGTVEVYDPATDIWTAKSEMPTARQGLSTSVVNGKIYAIGGGVSLSLIHI